MRGHGIARRWSRLSAGRDGPDDRQLIARIAAHDLRAFEALYKCYHPRLTRFLRNMIHRPQLVEEVIHDTLMVVWNRPDSFHGDSKLSTWIFGIAYRKALKAVRRQDDPIASGPPDTSPSADPGPDQRVNDETIRRALSEAIGTLSADHRAVVDLTYFHGLGYREIAEIMGCPVDTVKTRMFHARRHLKRLLAGELAVWL